MGRSVWTSTPAGWHSNVFAILYVIVALPESMQDVGLDIMPLIFSGYWEEA